MNLLAGEVAGGMLRIGDQQVGLTAKLQDSLDPATERVVVGIRPETFMSVEGQSRDHARSLPERAADAPASLVVQPDPASRELLGGETILRAALGRETVLVRLLGNVRDLPDRLAVATETLHLFSADDGKRLGP